MATTFTPYLSLLGGIMIGISATLLMLLLGRIAGITGIVSGALLPSAPADWSWRASFIVGMVAAPALAAFANIPTQPIEVPIETLALIVGGVVVGFGVTLGGGCTSGHGVCGLARFSMRSLVATLVFMIATGVTVYVTRHIVGG